MVTAWSRVPADAFIEGCARGWDNGAIVHHALGSTAIELAGDRAVAQTKMTIGSRSMVEDVLCDVVCTGRFYDFRSEEHTSELQSLMRISYDVFCLKKKKTQQIRKTK